MPMKLNDKKETTATSNKTSSSSSPYTEEWLPVKQIANGMIQNDDNEFIIAVKVNPKNIFILDESAQYGMIGALQNFYNGIDYEFWLIIADRPVDIKDYLTRLEIMYNKETNREIKMLILDDIKKANMFMTPEYNVVDTEYYFIIKDKKIEVLQKKVRNMINALASCGLSSMQASNEDLRLILDNFLNDGHQVSFSSVGV